MEVDEWPEVPLPMEMQLKNKIDELDKVHSQIVKGIITVREALNQRIRIMTECQVILQKMVKYELGE
jgi:hypothetical protein